MERRVRRSVATSIEPMSFHYARRGYGATLAAHRCETREGIMVRATLRMLILAMTPAARLWPIGSGTATHPVLAHTRDDR